MTPLRAVFLLMPLALLPLVVGLLLARPWIRVDAGTIQVLVGLGALAALAVLDWLDRTGHLRSDPPMSIRLFERESPTRSASAHVGTTPERWRHRDVVPDAAANDARLDLPDALLETPAAGAASVLGGTSSDPGGTHEAAVIPHEAITNMGHDVAGTFLEPPACDVAVFSDTSGGLGGGACE